MCGDLFECLIPPKMIEQSADFGVVIRAFADFVFGSMILHFFCVNFIN